ncbi:MAG: hypothetical protein J6K41_03985 [Paraprevotella sp.]|nr:hypothetical protein [Paraprevotella sp.]
MKSAQAYLEEFLGDPDKVAEKLRALTTKCHSAKEVGDLMRKLVSDEGVAEKRLAHKEVYQAFTDAAKLRSQGDTTGKAFREALKSWKAEQAEKAAKVAAAEEAEKAAAETFERFHLGVVAIAPGNKEEIAERAELDKKYGRIKEFMIIENPTLRELLRKEMIRKNIRITDKSHDLCDPLLAISSSKRRFLPRRRAWAA